MTSLRRQRLVVICLAGILLALVVTLALTALRDEITFFVTPAALAEKRFDPQTYLRIGGFVLPGSLQFGGGGDVRFRISDGVADIDVWFRGILPDLFREGQGAVAEGRLARPDHFVADRIFARHDENYIPREMAGMPAMTGGQAAGPQTGRAAIAPHGFGPDAPGLRASGR